MGSLLTDVALAFDDAYSGWIFWNLFLALIPLALSFWLFRPKAVPRSWRWIGLALVGLVGVVGLWPRLSVLAAIWGRQLQAVLAGNVTSLLPLLWLIVVLIVTAILGTLGLQRQTPKPWLWWLGFVTFIVFLPNAPYVLTDIIHLIQATSSGKIPTWVVALVFIPMHLAAILIGFEAYVLSLLNLAYYLKQHGAKTWILPTELVIHGLCALGIYLGRFNRLNSWELVTAPGSVLLETLDTLTSKRPLAVIMVTFIILTGFYWIMKQITLGLKLRIRYALAGQDSLD